MGIRNDYHEDYSLVSHLKKEYIHLMQPVPTVASVQEELEKLRLDANEELEQEKKLRLDANKAAADEIKKLRRQLELARKRKVSESCLQ